MTDVEFLKCSDQVESSMHLEVKMRKLCCRVSFDMRCLICTHERWLGPGTDELVQGLGASKSSALEKGDHWHSSWASIALMVSKSTGQSAAEL